MKAIVRYIFPFLLISFLVLGDTSAGLQAQDKTQVSKKEKKPGGSGREEDLNRFFGYEKPLVFRYLSTPYDSVMNTNLNSFTIELTYIFLLLLPLALFFPKKLSISFLIPAILALCLFLCIGIGSSYIYNNGIEASGALDHLAAQKPIGFFSQVQATYVAAALSVYVPLSNLLEPLSDDPDGLTYPALGMLFLLVWLG